MECGAHLECAIIWSAPAERSGDGALALLALVFNICDLHPHSIHFILSMTIRLRSNGKYKIET